MLQNKAITLSRDVFASGQVESKLWLCREAERLFCDRGPQTVWILGGWAGLLSFLLFSRENLSLKLIRSFDLDPAASDLAMAINESWTWRDQRFQAQTADCNQLDYRANEPSLIINTSVEHFSSDQWYQNIPKGKTAALQSCDLKHEDHIALSHSEEELKARFSFTKLLYSGTLKFDYKLNPFSRYMIIVEK